jgi:hypothetical protein
VSFNWLMTLALLAVGLGVAEIALWGRRQQAAARRRDGYLCGLARLLDLPQDTSPDARAHEIAVAVGRVLGADRCEWVPGLPRADDAVVGVAGAVIRAGRPVPVERSGLPTDAFTAVPVRRRGAVVGHFRVTTSTHLVRPTVEQRRVAALLADRMVDEVESPAPAGRTKAAARHRGGDGGTRHASQDDARTGVIDGPRATPEEPRCRQRLVG